MWGKKSKTGSRVLILVGQVIVLFVSFLYVEYIYTYNILPDKNARKRFLPAECNIINKRLSIQDNLLQGYRADFLVSYSIMGVQYNRWVSANGLDMEFIHDQATEEALLAKFKIGGNYPCWYDPDSPQIAVLLMRQHWASLYPLIFPLVVMITILFFLVRNLFYLFSDNARLSKRLRIKKKR